MAMTMPGKPGGQTGCGPHELNHAPVSDAAEVLEQVAVEAEIWAQHFGNAIDEVAVR